MYTQPEEYKNIINLAVQYKRSGKKLSDFCREKKTNSNHITEGVTHLEYLETIERLKKERLPNLSQESEQKMSFVQVPSVPAVVQQPEEAEVFEPQNDIEINITKGVKVLISPRIDSMKIIKIIELLKDL